MKPLIKKVHQAFLNIVHAYVKNKEIGVDISSDLSHPTGEDFALLSGSMTAEALLEKIMGIDAAETRKTFLLFLMKSAVIFRETDDINVVLSSLESIHALFNLSHSSIKTIDLMGENFSLYGFNGWRVSSAAALVQEHIYQKVLGITEDASHLPWFFLKALIESKSKETLVDFSEKDEHIRFLESKLDERTDFTHRMQTLAAEKDEIIAALEMRVAELVRSLELAQQRIHEQSTELQRVKIRPQLPLSPTSDAALLEERGRQLAIAQEQIDLQKQEILILQRKLKDKTETTVRVPSIMAGSGMFSGGGSMGEPPKQKRMGGQAARK